MAEVMFEEQCFWPVCRPSKSYDKTETYCWTPKLKKEDCGVDKYF
jgi:hypothetical protein